MKDPKLQDIFYFKGELVEVMGLGYEPFVGMRTIESCKCPHCGGDIGKKDIDGVIISSPLFQENAKPVNTLTEDENQIIEDKPIPGRFSK